LEIVGFLNFKLSDSIPNKMITHYQQHSVNILKTKQPRVNEIINTIFLRISTEEISVTSRI